MITDCPMCGRTIRVPDLDGTLAPLPAPKLDLKDAGLLNALDALASLDGADPVVALLEQPHSARPVLELKVQSPVVAAIPLEPLVVLPPAPPVPPIIEDDPLRELAEAKPVQRSEARPRSSSRKPRGALFLFTVLVSFGAGLALGYSLGSGAAAPEPLSTEAEPEEAPVIQEVSAPPGNESALAGHITYIGSNQQQFSDSGARVLLLPASNPGQTKLSVVGLRAGAAEADRLVAEAGVRAIGGDFVLANKTGRYRVHVKPGKYHLLVMSRYAPRDAESGLVDVVQTLANEYFDRPQLLVGQVAYHYQSITVDSTGQTLDHQFSP